MVYDVKLMQGAMIFKQVRTRGKYEVKHLIGVWMKLYGDEIEKYQIQVYPHPTYREQAKRDRPDVKIPIIRPPAIYDNKKFL